MKEKTLISKRWIVILLLSSALLLLALVTKISLLTEHWINSKMGHSALVLDYVIDLKGLGTLDVYEAEYYEAAVVIQPLIGNLVYFSNQGKYEPRIAESWERTSPNVWRFKLKAGFACENGEQIDSVSFKRSLERTIKHSVIKGGSPILTRLKGYSEFISGAPHLSGLVAEGAFLSFEFTEPLKGGLIEVLSFAPYGFICEANLKPDGSWANQNSFISSGPYKLGSFELGKQYSLELRSGWKSVAAKRAPEIVRISQELPPPTSRSYTIFDTDVAQYKIPDGLRKFELVPEYLNAILLGNLDSGFFSSLQNRMALRNSVAILRDKLPSQFGIHKKSSAFYSNVYTQAEPKKISFETAPTKALIIEGTEPGPASWKYTTWKTLKEALLQANIRYEFAGHNPAWSAVRSQDFDIRMRGTSVGGSADVWGIDVIFCSMIGPNYPDPDGLVCDLVRKYQDEKIEQAKFESEFLDAIEAGSAIIPISHFGHDLYLGEAVDETSIGPTLVVLRFDQVELK